MNKYLVYLRTELSLYIVYDRRARRTLYVRRDALSSSSSFSLSDSFIQFISITIKFTIRMTREGFSCECAGGAAERLGSGRPCPER